MTLKRANDFKILEELSKEVHNQNMGIQELHIKFDTLNNSISKDNGQKCVLSRLTAVENKCIEQNTIEKVNEGKKRQISNMFVWLPTLIVAFFEVAKILHWIK
jgi:hypothetical protein